MTYTKDESSTLASLYLLAMSAFDLPLTSVSILLFGLLILLLVLCVAVGPLRTTAETRKNPIRPSLLNFLFSNL